MWYPPTNPKNHDFSILKIEEAPRIGRRHPVEDPFGQLNAGELNVFGKIKRLQVQYQDLSELQILHATAMIRACTTMPLGRRSVAAASTSDLTLFLSSPLVTV